jgi:hypothetical protein
MFIRLLKVLPLKPAAKLLRKKQLREVKMLLKDLSTEKRSRQSRCCGWCTRSRHSTSGDTIPEEQTEMEGPDPKKEEKERGMFVVRDGRPDVDLNKFMATTNAGFKTFVVIGVECEGIPMQQANLDGQLRQIE